MRRLPCYHLIFGCLIGLALCSTATAYNPPVDTAGPLCVQIEGPETVTDIAQPLPVRVTLENQGDKPIDGTLQLKLVDRWTAEPGEAVKFSIAAKAKSTVDFTIAAGEPTYNAHYPIHALAQFTLDGQAYTAHPILIFETKFDRPPRAMVELPWKPQAMAPDSRLALWRLPIHRMVVQRFGQEPRTLPTGWQGSDAESRAHLSLGTSEAEGDRRPAVRVHPPYHGGAGTMLVEYPVVLPTGGPITLQFANAILSNCASDGVTFRVRVCPLDAPENTIGEVAFERHVTSTTWDAATADLSRFAGQSVRLQLEAHPGPKNNTSCDSCGWAEPLLSAGTPAVPAAFPPANDDGSKLLGTIQRDGQTYEVRLWPGKRGLLDTVVGLSCGEKRLFFNGFELSTLGARIDDDSSPIRLLGTDEESTTGSLQVRHHFECLWGPFDIVGRVYVENNALRTRFSLEHQLKLPPWVTVHLEDVALGPFSATATNVYAGHGNVLRNPKAFFVRLDGHRLSTSFVGFDFEGAFSLVQGCDVPPTELNVDPAKHHYSLHAAYCPTLTLLPSENAFQAARAWREVNGLKAAGGVKKAAGRFVFDRWGGGSYDQNRQQLERAFRYGLTDSMVVWHNWQRWGYDYRLPEICPPNPQFGTLEEMQGLVNACKQAGVLFAPHDNYIDYYPDAEGFSYESKIAFHPSGRPCLAWLNEGRGARSYRYRADCIEPILQKNLHWIRDNLAPTGYFIDVWSSAPPYDYWTADGQFHTKLETDKAWGDLFAWIRECLGDDAPQISESGHDQLIGYLDGAQTNHLRVGPPVPGSKRGWCVWNIECDDAERTPWFDAAHHDRFILHGAGYNGRYQGGLPNDMHGVYSDDYMATEVLTGHPAMVCESFNRNVVRKYWLLHELMRALALKTIEKVEFDGGPISGDLHRQKVTWSGGGEVWVNRGESDWTVEGHTLPQYGFYARVPGDGGTVETAVERRDGVVVSWARSPRELYVNGRRIVDHRADISVTANDFRDLGDGKFRFTAVWQAKTPIPEDYRPFVHVVHADDIVCQPHHSMQPLEAQRTGRIEVAVEGRMPREVKPGETYSIRLGMYNPKGGARLAMRGPDDGTRRTPLGTMRIKGQDSKVTGIGWEEFVPEPNPWYERQNVDGKPIDFGPIATAGGCRVTPEEDGLLVVPLPNRDERPMVVRLRPSAMPWPAVELKTVEILDEDGQVTGRHPIQRDGDAIVIECLPDVFGYRLVK